MIKTKVIGLLFLFSSTSWAVDDERSLPHFNFSEPSQITSTFGLKGPISALDLFKRTQDLFLNHLHMSPEPGFENDIQGQSGFQSLEAFNKMLPYFDPHKQFSRFAAYVSGQNRFVVFQDRDSQQYQDFSVGLAQAKARYVPHFESFAPTAQKPLAGLRIALDPGHMGGSLWDQRTGKYIEDGAKNRMSEGVLNLQTALLLKIRLEKLGAQVLSTREHLSPATDMKWDDLKLQDYIPPFLRSVTLTNWFISLIEGGAAGGALYHRFDISPHMRKIFSEDMRGTYFSLRSDLEARVQKIKAFKPHVTLVIHYDAIGNSFNPNGVRSGGTNTTKVYVPGGFGVAEFSSRLYRGDLAMHLFDPLWWKQSVDLGRFVLKGLETQLNLKAGFPADQDTVEIEPGLMARNLFLTRRISQTALAYAECLYYDEEQEFKALLQAQSKMVIDGKSYPVSPRLLQVVQGLENGILQFAAHIP